MSASPASDTAAPHARELPRLALYPLPLWRGRCRLLCRKCSNFYWQREHCKPRWLEHWPQNAILHGALTTDQ
ncbi:hypothetical protein [Ideonella sp.]|uniref:hypothetical protein n=1 Tax=Ideonella sp. TaxID=1929293 RepID=UPI0039C85CB1